MNIIRIFSNLVSTVKGEDFNLDTRIPMFYIIRLFISKIVSLIWGTIRLRTCKRIFIHPSTVIRCSSKILASQNLVIGRNCYIDALSQKGLVCGNNVSIGNNTTIGLTGSLKILGKGMIIGNNVGLGTHGYYGSGKGILIIGDDTILGNYVSIHPENHNYENLEIPIRLQGVRGIGVKIGKNCWIGAKVTILDGTIIGDNCIVAAGAVVKGEFPANSIIGGVPAKILKMRT